MGSGARMKIQGGSGKGFPHWEKPKFQLIPALPDPKWILEVQDEFSTPFMGFFWSFQLFFGGILIVFTPDLVVPTGPGDTSRFSFLHEQISSLSSCSLPLPEPLPDVSTWKNKGILSHRSNSRALSGVNQIL